MPFSTGAGATTVSPRKRSIAALTAAASASVAGPLIDICANLDCFLVSG
jgi:hypothetical protein